MVHDPDLHREDGDAGLVRWVRRGLIALGGTGVAVLVSAGFASTATADDGGSLLGGVTAGVAETVDDGAAPVVREVTSPLAGDVVPAAREATAAVTGQLEPAAEKATERASAAAEPPVRGVAEPVVPDAVTPVVQKVAEPVSDVAAPVRDVAAPVERVIAPVVQQATEPVDEVFEPVLGDVVEPLVPATTAVVESLSAVTTAVESIARPTTGGVVAHVVDTVAPALAPGTELAAPVDPVAGSPVHPDGSAVPEPAAGGERSVGLERTPGPRGTAVGGDARPITGADLAPAAHEPASARHGTARDQGATPSDLPAVVPGPAPSAASATALLSGGTDADAARVLAQPSNALSLSPAAAPPSAFLDVLLEVSVAPD